MTEVTREDAWPNSELTTVERAALIYCVCDDCADMQWCQAQPDEDEEDEDTGEIIHEPGERVCEFCYYAGFL